MPQNYLDTDLEIPKFLIHHYYISGSLCIVMNSAVFYLLIFRKGRLDTFRFYLLAFQVGSAIIFSVHLNFQIIFGSILEITEESDVELKVIPSGGRES